MTKNMPIYIALGANMSNPKETFPKALEALRTRNVEIITISSLWQSPAWPPGSGQPDYINAAAQVEFSGSAQELLAILHHVEVEFGRMRSVKNAPRTLDLDLLDFRSQIISSEGINVPHPLMLSRGFVLFPLEEVAPEWRDPIQKKPLLDHIAKLPIADIDPMKWMGRML